MKHRKEERVMSVADAEEIVNQIIRAERAGARTEGAAVDPKKNKISGKKAKKAEKKARRALRQLAHRFTPAEATSSQSAHDKVLCAQWPEFEKWQSDWQQIV